MKNLKVVLSIVGVAAFITGLAVFRAEQSRSVSFRIDRAEAADPSPVSLQYPVVDTSAHPPDPASPSLADQTEVAIEPVNPAHLKPRQVLATVNGKAIQLKDLVPVGPEETHRSMTEEQYDSRLNRAIEMELVFQSATAQGFGLAPVQQQRLDRIAENHQARLQESKRQGMSWSSVTPVQLEFEKRLMTALMLQQNLVVRQAKVAPSPDAALQARYEAALREILHRLRSNANITIAGAAL